MYANAPGNVKQQQSFVALPGLEGCDDPRCLPLYTHRSDCPRNWKQWCDTQDELQRLSTQLLEIQESERRRIAIDLHDVLGQSLTMIKLGVDESLQLLAENDPRAATEALLRLKAKAKEAIGEVRRVAMDLRPAIIDDLGILATLSWFFREFGAICQDMEIERNFSVDEGSVPIPLKITIFRIIQEASSNVAKHAKASRIKVALEKAGDMLLLSIEDDGAGFNPDEKRNFCPLEKSFGLLSMKERARLSGGHYELVSALGQGTRVRVKWPLSTTAA